MLKGNFTYIAFVAVLALLGIGGYVFVPKLVDISDEPEPAAVAAKPEGGQAGADTDPGAKVASKAASDEEAGTPQETASGEAASEPGEELSVPGFDVLRVEPDGSTVIAGSGEPNSRLQIINGEEVIATAEIGPSGDFAAVLDEPLAAGDYQLRLKSVMPDGRESVSEDVATVSVPEKENGQLLAMVGKPGEASRILTPPQPAAAKTGRPKEIARAETEAGFAMSDIPALPEGAELLAGSAPKTESEGTAAVDAASPEADDVQAAGSSVAPATQVEERAPAEMAALAPDSGSTGGEEDIAPQATSEESVRVDAVEIEGDKIFIAGAATPGYKVRVLADGAPVGMAEANGSGRFIVESVTDLPVGDHEIAAELIDPDTDQVVLRAIVPFHRPEGERMAAVAGEAESAIATEAGSASAADTGGSVSDSTGGVADAGGAAPSPQEQASPSASGESVPAASPGATAGQAAVSTAVANSTDAGPETVEQAPLQAAAGSVIIRRGDTLWEISRRTYGQGVRYTTIYLANQQQIVDPDLISPGQIFSVPDEPIDNALEVHHDLIEGRKPAPR